MREPGEPYRVLHIFGVMNRGGAEMRTLELMANLDPRQYHFDFCALSGKAGELDEEIGRRGGEVYPVKLDWRFPGRFRRLLRERRFDAVHSHVHYFSGYVLRLAAKEGVPKRIAHFRSTSDGRRPSVRRRLQRALMKRWLDRYATDVLAVNESAMREAWGPEWPADGRCRVVYNALDPARYTVEQPRARLREREGIPADARVYIHVGRMDPPKNHRRLLEIFGEILRLDPKAWLVLVGRGGTAIEEQVMQAAERAGIAERVVRLGVREDVPALLRMADVMVFPSLWEGLPGVVLEAVAVGTPVLANDLPGVREIVNHVSGIRTLTLSASDEEWACVAFELARSGVVGANARPEANGFHLRNTPFTIECALEHYRQIYA